MANVTYCQNLRQAMEIEEACFEMDGECSRCGGCCTRFLPITRGEEKEICRYVRKRHIIPENHGEADADLLCPFLQITAETTSCAIYPVRPKICRLWSCGAWARKDKSFLREVGKKCADRPGLMDCYDMYKIFGDAPDAELARMILEARKWQERQNAGIGKMVSCLRQY